MSESAPRALPRWIWLLAYVVAAFGLYGPALGRAEFLNFDDNLLFGPTGALRTATVWDLLNPSQTLANAYLPVAHLSLWLDYQLAGDAAWWPRLHSLLLHAVVAFALARLAVRSGLSHPAGLAAGALFLVHPALVESVAWVSSRKDLLSGLFAILCLSAFAEELRRPAAWRRAGIAALTLAALYAKATAMVLPLLALLIGRLVPDRVRGAWRRPGLTVVVIAAAAVVHHALIAAREGTLAGAVDGGLGSRAAQVPGALWHYLATALWPTGLNVLYPEVATLESFRANAALATVVLLALAAALLVASAGTGRRRLVGVTGLCALAACLPFNTALPASFIAAADRYLYLVVPFVALCLAAALGRFAPPVLVVLSLFAALLTWRRVPDFDTSERLWRSSLQVDQANAVACLNLAMTPQVLGSPEQVRQLVEQAALHARYPQHQLRAQTWLADIAWRDQRVQAAVQHAERALVAAKQLPAGPASDVARVRASLRGAVMARTSGELATAERLAAVAFELAPDHPAVLAYRASAMLAKVVGEDGRLRDGAESTRVEAFALLDRAKAADPGACDPWLVRAQWLAAAGESLPALKAFDDALTADPARAEAHLGKVELLLNQEMFAKAEVAARAALRVGVDDAALLSKLAYALAAQNRLDDAKAFYESYLALRPTDTKVRQLLAALLANQARHALYQLDAAALEARAGRIRELDPNNAHAHVLLAVARRQQKRLPDALVLLEGAHQRLPEDQDVPRLLAETHRDLGYLLLLATKDRDRAIDHLGKFVAMAPADLDTGAARNLLREECARLEDVGVKAFEGEQLDAAEAAFRRRLAVGGDHGWTQYQLGLTLLKRGGESTQAALQMLQAAEVALRAEGIDASRAVLYQIHALRRLGRGDEAVSLARRFLGEHANQSTAAYERIRALVE